MQIEPRWREVIPVVGADVPHDCQSRIQPDGWCDGLYLLSDKFTKSMVDLYVEGQAEYRIPCNRQARVLLGTYIVAGDVCLSHVWEAALGILCLHHVGTSHCNVAVDGGGFAPDPAVAEHPGYAGLLEAQQKLPRNERVRLYVSVYSDGSTAYSAENEGNHD